MQRTAIKVQFLLIYNCMVIFQCFERLSSCLRYIHTCPHLFLPYSIVKNNTLKQEWSILSSPLSTTYFFFKLTMLHTCIRLTFIGIKTGWGPKLSAGPLETNLGSPACPWRKNVKLCPWINVKQQCFYCCSTFHSHGRVFNNVRKSCTSL